MTKIAIYDMDRTITHAPTWTPFLLSTARRHAPWRLLLAPAVAFAMLGYTARLVDRAGLKQTMQRLLLGGKLAPERVEAAATAFADRVVATGVFAGARAQIEADRATDPAVKAKLAKTAKEWADTAKRYDDDPEGGEGRKQLMAKAQAAEHKRELDMARYHNYEFASAAFQIGIVLASAQVITGMVVLGWLSGLLGVTGIALTGLGLWAPHALDFLTHAAEH